MMATPWSGREPHDMTMHPVREDDDDTPCPFVRAPFIERGNVDPRKPTANEECYACGQRLWQHEAPARPSPKIALCACPVNATEGLGGIEHVATCGYAPVTQ